MLEIRFTFGNWEATDEQIAEFSRTIYKPLVGENNVKLEKMIKSLMPDSRNIDRQQAYRRTNVCRIYIHEKFDSVSGAYLASLCSTFHRWLNEVSAEKLEHFGNFVGSWAETTVTWSNECREESHSKLTRIGYPQE